MLEELHSDLSCKLKTPTRHFTKCHSPSAVMQYIKYILSHAFPWPIFWNNANRCREEQQKRGERERKTKKESYKETYSTKMIIQELFTYHHVSSNAYGFKHHTRRTLSSYSATIYSNWSQKWFIWLKHIFYVYEAILSFFRNRPKNYSQKRDTYLYLILIVYF